MRGWFAEAVYISEVVNSKKFRGESTMYTEKLLVHDRCEREGAERLHASIIHTLGVLMFTFNFEGEVFGQTTALVISTEKEYRAWVVYFERPQIEYTLNAEISSIYVVSQKQISCRLWASAFLEELHEVVILTVDVSTDCDGSVDVEDVRFRPEQRCCLVDDPKCMIVFYPTLSEEVVLQKGEVGFGAVWRGEELRIGGYVCGWCEDVLYDSLPCANRAAVVEPLLRVVDGRTVVSELDLLNGSVHLALRCDHRAAHLDGGNSSYIAGLYTSQLSQQNLCKQWGDNPVLLGCTSTTK